MEGEKICRLIERVMTKADRDRYAAEQREALLAHLANDTEGLKFLELSEDATMQATLDAVGQVLATL